MITKLSKTLHSYFRTDLQLHFLWSFFSPTLAVFSPFMIWSGLIATLIKEENGFLKDAEYNNNYLN